MADDETERLFRRSPEIALLAERVKLLTERLDALEKKQSEVSSLMNKGMGAAAVLTGIGAVIGWLVSIGGTLLKGFR